MIGRELTSPFVVSLADLTERQQRRQRTCAHDGCGTILSQYNPSTYCAAHEPEPEVFEHQGYRFRVCRCGEVYQVNKAGGSPLCPECKRDVVRASNRTRAPQPASRPPQRSLRKDGKPDAVQRTQRRIGALSPKGVMSFDEVSA